MRIGAIILCFALAVSSTARAQTTWYVDDDCTPPGVGTEAHPFCTIQAAVNAAARGDTVLVLSGVYTGPGNRDISLFGKSISLRSSGGPEVTTIDIQGSPAAVHRGFFLVHGEKLDTLIDGFTIINGYLIGDTGGTGGGGGGGGFYIRSSSPTIRNCIIRDHISAALSPPFPVDGRGAGIYIDGHSSAVFENCVIADNHADRRGGGAYIGYDDSQVEIRDCLLIGNSSGEAGAYPGGGIHNTFGRTTIANTTIAHNSSPGSGGGIKNEQGDLFMSNCILWGNEAVAGPQLHAQGGFLGVEFGDIEEGMNGLFGSSSPIIEWGPGNIDADPLFFDPLKGDYRLRYGSPCIDAGNNLALPEGVTGDLDGNPRFLDDPDTPDTGNPDGVNPIVDMGAYEFNPTDCNHNDLPDDREVARGRSADCNANGVPDECEADCNGNDLPDVCDIAKGISDDCTLNGLPDECEPDCNSNGQADSCDLAGELSADCNANAVPDECEPDCNANGQADECDLTQGLSMDCNANGVPDECAGEPVGPPITEQPQSQEAEPGDLVMFSVAASGVLFDFHWRKDGVELSNGGTINGANSATLYIFPVAPSDAGSYDCVILDYLSMGCSVSDPAQLTVTVPCPADLDGDGAIGAADLPQLLSAWGPNPGHPADLDDNGTVGPADLALLLGNWGPCP